MFHTLITYEWYHFYYFIIEKISFLQIHLQVHTAKKLGLHLPIVS